MKIEDERAHRVPLLITTGRVDARQQHKL